MKKQLSILTGVALAASFALPLNAAPFFAPIRELGQTNSVERVKNSKHGNWRVDRHWDGRYEGRSCGYYGRCYPRQYGYYGRPGYYGHREYYGDPGYYRYHRQSGVSIYLNF